MQPGKRKKNLNVVTLGLIESKLNFPDCLYQVLHNILRDSKTPLVPLLILEIYFFFASVFNEGEKISVSDVFLPCLKLESNVEHSKGSLNCS